MTFNFMGYFAKYPMNLPPMGYFASHPGPLFERSYRRLLCRGLPKEILGLGWPNGLVCIYEGGHGNDPSL